MSRRLPPLNAVRAFEAAARLGSFRKAADELFVTPNAVAAQVKSLEEWVGLALFKRLSRGVVLTEAGERYWPALAELLDGIEAATGKLRENAGPRVLTLATVPSFASRWLVPRLGRLHTRVSDLQVRVQVGPHLTDFRREPVDVVIRHGAGVYPGLSSTFLLKDVLFPVCSPRLLETGPPLRGPWGLGSHVLLHDEPDRGFHEPSWADWLAVAGVEGIDPRRGPMFSFTHMTIQAALSGQGVALAPATQVVEELQSGRLVRPFSDTVPDPFSYWLVCPTERVERPDIVILRDWLVDEIKAFRQCLEGLGLGDQLTRTLT